MLPTPSLSTGRFALGQDDDAYPAHLRLTPRPPKVIRGFGDPASLVPGLAVIGSRKASPYGLECARRFAGLAAREGITIISGGAIGCDLAAHRAALAEGAPTVVVLGCGADVDYPRSGADVFRDVRQGRGAVVSELEWGAPPLPGQFPARNRIIAGLAAAVLVVEAALPSGTFSTADHALEAGRDVLAVPGSVFFAGSAGCNRLIRQGAQPITCDEDLIDSLAGAGLLDPVLVTASGQGALNLAGDDPVLEALRANPMAPGRLAELTGMDAVTALQRLARLEQSGLVTLYPDGRYGPCSHR